MKVPAFAVWGVLLWTAAGLEYNHGQLRRRRLRDEDVSYPEVPSYNFTMPVDHFDSSNEHTYPNRYFVNDTYYKPGGPVILFDFGESGASPGYVAQTLAEFNGTTSASMQLAKKLGGLVIGWEHRYYGYSQPVEIYETMGIPSAGAAGYKYLTVEQALEDVAYFANRFNATSLDKNDVVQNTTDLDPYNTPWIFIGGSYPGARAAWARLKYPEIFYASWASSAPVQSQADGSIYYDPAVRALPTNCTNDIKAAVKYVDDTLESGSTAAARSIKLGLHYVLDPGTTLDDTRIADSMSSVEVGQLMTFAVAFPGYQGYGAARTTQVMCDYMETFDLDTFLEGDSGSVTTGSEYRMLFRTTSSSKPRDDGIAAAYGEGKGGQYAFDALLYGMYYAKADVERYTDTLPPVQRFTDQVDEMSWTWQSTVQLGYFQGSNPQNPDGYISRFYTYSAARKLAETYLRDFSASDFPSEIDNSEVQKMGGWNMTASNVMFTNGQFDPWRAFSVSSEEQDDGAPSRNTSQTIPKCNQPPPGTDVFGIVYNGAVHGEDMSGGRDIGASIEKVQPLEQGLDLFLKAWDEWQPCFNTSRDDVRNGKGVDGQGNGADGGKGGNKDSDKDDSGSGGVAVKASGISTALLTVAVAVFSVL